jgi:hypothetical protein
MSTQAIKEGMLSSQLDTSMTDEQSSKPDADQPVVYQIRIKGHLGRQWMSWFDDLTIALEEDGSTLLSGPVVDQSALHGILKKVRDLGIPLLSVNSVHPDHAVNTDTGSYIA